MSDHKIVWTKIFGGVPPTNMTHIRDLDNALIVAGAAAVAGVGINFLCDLVLSNAVGTRWLPDLSLAEHALYWMRGFMDAHGADWTKYRAWLDSMNPVEHATYVARVAALAVAPIGFATKAFVSSSKVRPIERHTGGRRLFEGEEGATELERRTKAFCNAKGAEPGIPFHPRFRLTMRQECENFVYVGAAGSGKTVALKPFVFRAGERGDKRFIFDNKGEWTEELQNREVEEVLDDKGNPTGVYRRRIGRKWFRTSRGSWIQDGRPERVIDAEQVRVVKIGNPGGVDKVVIIAPWDERSFAWDIAADCLNEQDAIEISKRFIPDSKDPMWSEAAQQVFRAFLLKLIYERRDRWGWSDLAELIEKPIAEVKEIVGKYMPLALDAISDIESKTTQSIMITMKSFMSNILMLAKAWGDQEVSVVEKGTDGIERTVKRMRGRQRISFRKFILDDDYKHRTIVVQGNGRYGTMARNVMQSILTVMAATMNSPECPDKDRRIWLFLDEFPQLGKVDCILQFLEVGRSKGIRFVAGMQDVSQMTTNYSQAESDTFFSNVKRWVVFKLMGSTANWMSDTIGTRRFQKRVYSGTLGQRDLNFSEVDGERPVMLPSEFETKLGVNSSKWDGANGLLLGYEDAFIVNFPFSGWTKTQPAGVEAEWWTRIWKETMDDSGKPKIVLTADASKTPPPAAPVVPQAAKAGTMSDEQRNRILEKIAARNDEHEQRYLKRLAALGRRDLRKVEPPLSRSTIEKALLINSQTPMTEQEERDATIRELESFFGGEAEDVGEIVKTAAVHEAAHAAGALIPGADMVVHAAELVGEIAGGEPRAPTKTVRRMHIESEESRGSLPFLKKKPPQDEGESDSEGESEGEAGL